MPIPKPNAGESESDFMERCVPALLDEYDQEQAAAICYKSFRGDDSEPRSAPRVETRSLPDVPTVTDDERIEGYAAVFYQEGNPQTEMRMRLDNGIEVVERIIGPDAFNERLEVDEIISTFDHNENALLGRRNIDGTGTLTVRVDEVGLHYSIDPTDAPTIYADTVKRIKRGDVRGSSYQFIAHPNHEEFRRDGNQVVRELRGFAALRELGPVTRPAYDATTAEARSELLARVERLEDKPAGWRGSLDHYRRVNELIRLGA